MCANSQWYEIGATMRSVIVGLIEVIRTAAQGYNSYNRPVLYQVLWCVNLFKNGIKGIKR